MSFQSLEYICFLPIIFILYWSLFSKTKNLQNVSILLANIVFYGWSDWRFLGLVFFTAFTTFYLAYLLNNIKDRYKKFIFIATIFINVIILFIFKYYNFFIESVIDTFKLFGQELSVHTVKIILPIGISFYTFSALSYVIDVYQNKVQPQRDLLAYLAYLTFFPSILSGPINRAQIQLPQYYHKRKFNYNSVVAGLKLILWGAIMKLCLADRLGIYVDTVFSNISNHNGTTLLFTSLLYSIQIYGDFAGYSMMAIGSGKLFGIKLQENFQRPYLSKTITEFWRRWHISLTTWFRDYIYFPLGGNRVSRARWIINTLIVFVISGLWHGAAYTFLVWGVIHGFFMILERIVYQNRIKQINSDNRLSISNILRITTTFSIVSFAWIFFRAQNIQDAIEIFRKIAIEPGQLFIDTDTFFYASFFIILVFIKDIIDEYSKNSIFLMNSSCKYVRWITYLSLVIFVLLFGVLDGGSFIYFQF